MTFSYKSTSSILSALIIVLFFTSCTQKQKGDATDLTGYTKRTIKLINGLGVVSIYLPNELDTAFAFLKYSDVEGPLKIFRFSSKKYILDSDGSPFPGIMKIDSLYQFTIEQFYYLTDTGQYHPTIDSNELNSLKRQMGSGYYRGQLLKVHNRSFLVVQTRELLHRHRSGNDSSIFSCQLWSGTYIKKQWVSFAFTCLKKDTTGFTNRMLKSLKTIEISN